MQKTQRPSPKRWMSLRVGEWVFARIGFYRYLWMRDTASAKCGQRRSLGRKVTGQMSRVAQAQIRI
jgi:hypothetical protein